jgi:hypothetical protein
VSINNNESKAQVLELESHTHALHIEPYSHLKFFDRLFNLDSGVLFYIPIWLHVARHEYPNPGLKSGVWWFDGVFGRYSKYVKKSVKSDKRKFKRERHWAYREAHEVASKPILAVSDEDFYDRDWWVDFYDFEVENIDVKHDGYVYLFSKKELKYAVSNKIPVWIFLSVEVKKAILEFAIRYYNEVHDKKIILMNESGDKILVLNYLVRFSEKYLKKIKHDIFERGRYLKRFNNFGYKSTFITLTISISDYSSYQQILNILTKMFHKFITHLRHYVDFLDYIRFFEIGKKRDTIHIHLLLINKLGFINADIVRTAWSVNGELIGGVHIKYFNNIIGGIRYILKYITKLLVFDYNGDVNKLMFEKGFILLSLLWATNKRLYSVSAKFTKEIKRLFMLEFNRVSAKNFVVRVWFGFVVDSVGLMYYSGKFSHLYPPEVVGGGWVYVGSYDSAVFPLPCGIYDRDVVKEYLYLLFSV